MLWSSFLECWVLRQLFQYLCCVCTNNTILLIRLGIFCSKPGKNMLVKLFKSINKCTSHSCTEFWVTAKYNLILHTHTHTQLSDEMKCGSLHLEKSIYGCRVFCMHSPILHFYPRNDEVKTFEDLQKNYFTF